MARQGTSDRACGQFKIEQFGAPRPLSHLRSRGTDTYRLVGRVEEVIRSTNVVPGTRDKRPSSSLRAPSPAGRRPSRSQRRENFRAFSRREKVAKGRMRGTASNDNAEDGRTE